MTPDGYIEAQAWMTATATRAVLAALTADTLPFIVGTSPAAGVCRHD